MSTTRNRGGKKAVTVSIDGPLVARVDRLLAGGRSRSAFFEDAVRNEIERVETKGKVRGVAAELRELREALGGRMDHDAHLTHLMLAALLRLTLTHHPPASDGAVRAERGRQGEARFAKMADLLRSMLEAGTDPLVFDAPADPRRQDYGGGDEDGGRA